MRESKGKADYNRLRNLAIYLFGALLTRGIAYLSTPIFTRLMTKEEYGVLSLFTSWVAIFSIFVALQVSGTIPSAFVKYKEDVDKYIASVLLLSLCPFLALGAAGICFRRQAAVLLQFSADAAVIVPLILFVAYGKAMANLYVSYTIQRKQAKTNITFSATVALASLTLGCLLTLLIRTQKYYGRIIGEAIVYALVIAFVFQRFRIWTGRRSGEYWRDEIALSLPLIVHLLATNVISHSDRVFITNMLGEAANAVYSVAYTIGMIALVAVEAAFNVWTPWFFSCAGAEERREEINKTARCFILIISMIHGFVILFSREIFWIMAPEGYSGGVDCTVVITVSTLFSFFYRFPLSYEHYRRQLNWVAVATITAAVSNLALNALLIPRMGMLGAAVATAISTAILWLIHEAAARKIIKGFPLRFGHYIAGILTVIPCIAFESFFRDDIALKTVFFVLYGGGEIAMIYRKNKSLLQS